MISLFLVEDERIARESIRDNVPWQEHDILFLGDAPDGEVALPQLLEKRPDILLTDIKMPFMDGLELARIVRKELPDTRIIILSGHNEFEYARKAITLGVNDYLLKPVSSRDILEAVDRSKAQILECRARRIERQSHSITQRELFFSNLYSGILMGPAQMLQRAAQLGISLAAGAYQIILTELDGVIPDREALRDKLYAAPMAYGSGFDGERATFLLLAEHAEQLLPTIRSRCVELRLSPLPEAVLLPALRERFPDVPEGTLRAAGVRAGGYLGRAESILRDDAGLLPQSAAFVRAYCARRPEELLQVLAPMERLKREQLRPILTQWQALLVSALTSRSGLPPLRPECAQIAEARPVSDITQAIEAIRLALRDLEGNVSPGAICGALTVKLR